MDLTHPGTATPHNKVQLDQSSPSLSQSTPVDVVSNFLAAEQKTLVFQMKPGLI
jgi:hypothetical protein